MKKSEKLFLAINEIDEKIVDEAKGEEQKPVRVKFEKRMPIKEIIAFAACFAVLAVAIFALVKFKLSDEIEPQPIDSDSSEYSSEQSSVSNPEELSFTEQDRELQAILNELVPKAEEIDGIFNMSAIGEKYTFNIGDYYQNDYYLIPKDQRTANGLFAVPQNYNEMEQLISKYFSPQAAEFYMSQVCRGIMTANADGTYNVEIDSEDIPVRGIFEINNNMYFIPWGDKYPGMGIDCETAKVIRKTDKVVEFTYWGYNYSVYNIDGDVYSERKGVLVNKDGTWKLHYFYGYGFIPEIPTEYTEQDMELQKLLETLALGDKASYLFMPDITDIGMVYEFVFPGISGYVRTYRDISGPEQEIDFPKSYDEFEQRLLENFTREATDRYMMRVCKGTMTQNSDETYSVILDKEIDSPAYIEINGKMFCATFAGSGIGVPYYNTAKVIEQTSDTIIFSYTKSYYGTFECVYERLVYERGGWKRDPFYEAPDPDADNKELQAILKELVPKAGEIDRMFNQMSITKGEPDIKTHWADYYVISDGLRTEPNSLFAVPQTYDEMESLIRRYFSKRAADFYLTSNNICKGSAVENADGTFTIEPDNKSTVFNPIFIEIDGKMYRSDLVRDMTGLNLGIDCETAKVTRKSDKTIEFSYWGYDYTALSSEDRDAYSERNGAIVYEDGAWKLNYFYYQGFIPEMPNEYTEQDLELQKILETLKPGDNVKALFSANSAYASGDLYNFILPQENEPKDAYFQYIDVSGPQPSVKHPKSIAELEEMLLEYLTEELTHTYMNRVCKGTMTENDNGTYTVTLDKDVFFPVYIEIDGKMFYYTSQASGSKGFYDTAKVVEWTDDTIIYSYVGAEPGGYEIWDGTLKFERGGWKMN